jgi:hypothetical protein
MLSCHWDRTRRFGKIEALDTGQKEKSAVKVYRRGERRSSEVRPRENYALGNSRRALFLAGVRIDW